MIDKGDVKNAVDDWYVLCVDMGVELPDNPVTARRGIPCPVCGGDDRFSYNCNAKTQPFYCRTCGPMDGIELIKRVKDWSFSQTINNIGDIMGLKTHTIDSSLRDKWIKKKATKQYNRALAILGCAKGAKSPMTPDDQALLIRARLYVTRYETKWPEKSQA